MARRMPVFLMALSMLFGPRAALAQGGIQQAASAPTAHIFGVRLGMVGGVTASGHVIAAHDHFVALPSSRALSSPGTSDHSVLVTYKGRSLAAPVWDVGPWNDSDDFWAVPRTGAPGLARMVPEAQAASMNGYNGGLALDGHTSITSPAAIDIADGLFEDLGMTEGDWVDVSFLWLTS